LALTFILAVGFLYAFCADGNTERMIYPITI
jgi:hypothetical protein